MEMGEMKAGFLRLGVRMRVRVRHSYFVFQLFLCEVAWLRKVRERGMLGTAMMTISYSWTAYDGSLAPRSTQALAREWEPQVRTRV